MSTAEESKEAIRRIQKELEEDYKKKYQWLVGTCLKYCSSKVVKVTEIIYVDDHRSFKNAARYKCIVVRHDFLSQGMSEEEDKLNYEINTNAFGIISDDLIAPYTVSDQVFQDELYYTMTKINELAKAKEAQS